MQRHELELKGTKQEIDGAIALLVNSGYTVRWDKSRVGNATRKVLVASKGEE